MSTMSKYVLAGMFTFAVALSAQAADTVVYTQDGTAVATPVVIPNSGTVVTSEPGEPATLITGYNGTEVNPNISPFREDGTLKTGREVADEQDMLESYVYND